MTMSLEEFRAALVRADLRGALGLQLTDIEAQQVAADAASTQSWYAYWVSANPTPPPPSVAAAASPPPPPPAADAAPSHQTPPPYQGSAPVADAQPTAPYPSFSASQQQAYATAVATADGHPAYAGAGVPAPYPGFVPGSDGEPAKKKRVGLWVTLSIVGALVLIAAIVVIAAFATARHWTKVDVPEQPETFHSEEYETGRYDVAMDDVNPCFINQDWTDCTNMLVATYEANCVGVELTETAALLCTEYSGAIDEMRAQDGEGYYVATLGTYGTLSRTPEIGTREVSNNDQRPAETHEAVCYLEFLGECE